MLVWAFTEPRLGPSCTCLLVLPGLTMPCPAAAESERQQWAKALRSTGLQVHVYPDDGPADPNKEVEFAIVWGRHPALWKQVGWPANGPSLPPPALHALCTA